MNLIINNSLLLSLTRLIYTVITKLLNPINCMNKKFMKNTLSKSGASKGQFLKDGYKFWLNT